MLVGLLLATSAYAPGPLGAPAALDARDVAARSFFFGPAMGMLDKKAPGSKANIGDYADYSFAKRVEPATTDDGACFIVPDDEAPDPSKDWFYCNDPSEDDDMVCELVPEWMGTSPSGDHAVWLCSKLKPE